jgi:hypothetical protein
LAVVLYRLGGKSTVWDLCSKFGIAEGTVQLFTFRITLALKSLKSYVIVWLRGDYRQEVHKGFEEKCESPNAIGALDGSHTVNLTRMCILHENVAMLFICKP